MSGSVYLNSYVPIAILPVLVFLSALVWLDSFKLVTVRFVLGVVLSGALAAGAAYFSNVTAYQHFSGSFVSFSRYVSPFIEEAIKAIPVVALFRMRRIGLLVDAAIVGFAVGAGFALVENIYYLANRLEAILFIQVIRGFGTAIMHGGATAAFAVVTIVLQERGVSSGIRYFVPAFSVAALLHSLYNHFLVQPLVATLLIAGLLPILFVLLFRYGEQNLRDWIESGMNAKLTLLREIRSGAFLDTPAGQYLEALRHRFSGETLADMLCYVRLHCELALRAQGILLMRETGWDEPPLDDEVVSQLTELRHIERSIGLTGLAALHPLVAGTGKDLWQLTLLGHR